MNKKIVILLLSLLLFANIRANALSTCSYKEQADLNSEAAQIKVKYEEKIGELDHSLYDCGEAGDDCSVTTYYLSMTILNMSENFYIEVSNNINKNKNVFTYDDVKEGVITFDHEDIYQITNYTFDVYSSVSTGCPNEKIRTIHLTTPKFNSYYYDGECNDAEDHYLCQKYISTEEPSFNEFVEQLTNYKIQKEKEREKNNRNFIEKIFNFVDNHKAFIGVTTTIVVVGVATVVIVKKRKEII